MTGAPPKALPASLTTDLSKRATGFAAVIDGVMNVDTIGSTQNQCAHGAFYAMGIEVHSTCYSQDCDCYVRVLKATHPSVLIVPVTVTLGVENG